MAKTVIESLEARAALYERISYDIVDDEQGGVDVYYHLVPEDLEKHSATRGWRILNVSPSHLTIYPFKDTVTGFEPKYSGIASISVTARRAGPYQRPETNADVEALMDELPEGLEKSPLNGLGFSTLDRFIPTSIASLAENVRIVVQGGGDAPTLVDGVYVLSQLQLKQLVRAMRSISSRYQRQGRADKRLLAHNALLTSVDSERFPALKKKLSAEAVFELVKVGRVKSQLPKNAQRNVIDLVADNASDLAKTEPEKLRELVAKIESATLQEMIQEYEAMLQKSLSETKWQAFFEANTFLLSLVFAVPTVFVQERPYVQGKRLNGRGGKFSDFLMCGQGTGNVALIEIKAPDTPILSPYRDEQKGPSRDLAGAITQVLGQRLQLNISWGTVKLNDDGSLKNSELHAPQAVVLIGSIPKDKADRQAFELFRQVLKDVSVITFDELLLRLKYLHEALGGAQAADVASQSEIPL